ncbi:hypothetical protein DAPPUDRAFT_260329 [Daphnia pulex]|uniref:CUB domain-containing protein n=1 Tax=Daphnia pulex TaxID=6669 RepID=E9HIY7_DAPPU|nr:hypothetical protein DAPPUDRAFT_260329 [Daphnia pulex]|eukprot:EFX68307.1 hypothetical protein DAPPUDRAFT_260329 [Daphnia pulex]
MCGNATSATTGVIQSPNFPGDYGNDSRTCIVTITAPADWMIQLKFSTFNVETGSDSVYANDGLMYLMSPTTGNTIPALVPAATNAMSIYFSTSVSSKPSSAVYNWQATLSVTSQGSSCSTQDPVGCSMCRNVTSSGSGVVQSPNFPARYPNSFTQCFLTMIVPAGKRIQLTFTTFNLESDRSSIYVSDSEMYYLEGATGSAIPAVVTARSNKMFLTFNFDGRDLTNSATYNWQATYTVVLTLQVNNSNDEENEWLLDFGADY